MAENNEQLREQLARAMQDDPWSRYNRPFGELKGTAPEDTPAVFNTKTGVKITEGDIQRGIDVGMGAATVGGPQKGPIKAYHSSPHDFDKFDLSKIGTGEGAQAYGHGVYAAENPAVSGQGGQYWQQFLRRFEGTPEGNAAKRLRDAKFDREAAVEIARRDMEKVQQRHDALPPELKDLFGQPTGGVRASRMQELDLLQSGKPLGPRTYELDINADPKQMLDWDKSLHGQSPEVRNALERFGLKADPAAMRAYDDALYAALSGEADVAAQLPKQLYDPTGDAIYGRVARAAGRSGDAYFNRQAGSEALLEAGIPGIKYLDEGSRISSREQITALRERLAEREARYAAKSDPTDLRWMEEYRDMLKRAENPTSNFVVFDPTKIDIRKKYGIAAGPGAGAAAAASGEEQN
jgi:hypothetical protein